MANIHFNTAWGYIRRSPFQALAAIFVLTITFFVSTLLAFLMFSSQRAITYFETRPQVIAFISDEADSTAISSLQNKLMSDTRVKNVNYVTKEMALEIYKEATSDNPLLAELVSPDIFPASLEFSVADLSFAEEVINEVKEEDIVDEVGFTANLGGESKLSDVVGRLRTITWYIRVGGGAFILMLLSTSFMVLTIIIGMRISTRKGEIEILKLIGATPSFIRNPIIIEAMAYSLAGVFLGWMTTLVIFLYATPSLVAYFGDIPIIPKNTVELLEIFLVILAGEILIGIFIAFSGSMLAVTRAKKKR